MRFAVTSLLLIVLLGACKKHGESKSVNSEAKLQQQLTGTWKMERVFTDGGLFQSTVMVAANGAYICNATNFGSKGIRPFHMEGTWEIKDGFLIDTMTKNNNTNARLPSVSSEKITHFNTNELAIKHEYNPSNSFEAVFKKEPGN